MIPGRGGGPERESQRGDEMIHQEDKHKRGAASRMKGKRSELELAKIFRDWYGYDVHRGKTYYHESDLVGLDGIHPEVKRQEKLNIYKAMEQATEEAEEREDGLPTVFHRRDKGEWMVTMKLKDWADLYNAWRDE